MLAAKLSPLLVEQMLQEWNRRRPITLLLGLLVTLVGCSGSVVTPVEQQSGTSGARGRSCSGSVVTPVEPRVRLGQRSPAPAQTHTVFKAQTPPDAVAAAPDTAPAGAAAGTSPQGMAQAEAPMAAPTVPAVLLTARDAQLSKLAVGESFPPVKLPKLGGSLTELASLLGEKATVVLFWRADRWMAEMALTDLQHDVGQHFASEQVALVGIAVQQPAQAVRRRIRKSQVRFPQLLDTRGQVFAQVGDSALPRVYVLDPAGEVVWYDLEYSLATRRELAETLALLTAP